MASTDKCYAVAAYNLVSEEHHHFHVMGTRFRTVANDAKIRCLLFTIF